MFLGHRLLETTLTFYAQFIDNTGAASNVDAGAPAYSIYEEETAAAILSGSMTQQGGWGAGLYSEQVTLAAASGFEEGKDYVIRISGTISGVVPAALHHFRIDTPVPELVWDEALAGHLGAGTTGEALNAAQTASTPAAVAAAVWNALKASHQGDTIMGNMAQDLDNLEFDGRAR